MTPSKQSAEIRLCGQRIVLKTSSLDSELVKEVVELVGGCLERAEKRSPTTGQSQVALLALLDLAEEYIKAKRRVQDFQLEVLAKSESLLQLVEEDKPGSNA